MGFVKVDTRWLEAPCRTAGDEMFPEGSGGKKNRLERQAIKKYCNNCPMHVFLECREEGKHQPFGIWGGETEQYRKEVYVCVKLFS